MRRSSQCAQCVRVPQVPPPEDFDSSAVPRWPYPVELRLEADIEAGEGHVPLHGACDVDSCAGGRVAIAAASPQHQRWAGRGGLWPWFG